MADLFEAQAGILENLRQRMFGIGIFELLVILVVAVIALGPNKLPQTIVDIVKFFRAVKKTMAEAKDTFDKELQLSELKEEALKYKQNLENQVSKLTQDMKLDELREISVESVVKPLEEIQQKLNEPIEYDSSSAKEHSALSDKSAINKARGVDEPLSPCSPCQSPDFSSQILECQTESSPKDSKKVSESTASDSELPSGGVYLHRDKNKNAHSRNLEASSGWEQKNDSKGEGASLPNLSPSPLDEKEKENLSTHRISEAKALDSQATDSESERAISADSKGVDCHADKPARNDDATYTQADSKNAKPHTLLESHTPADSHKNLESPQDSQQDSPYA